MQVPEANTLSYDVAIGEVQTNDALTGSPDAA
jgi:hypothetical protein